MSTPLPSILPPSATGATYIHGHHDSVLRAHSWRTVDNSAAYLIPHLAAGVSLLDVGSGPGTITSDLAARVAPGRVIGVDAAESIVALTNAQAADVPNLSYETGDATALRFDDDSFDIVHAHQVLQHLPDPIAALREFRRVTKPSGIVAARDVDYVGAIWFPASSGLDRWMELYQNVARANSGEPNAGRRLKSWARQAGFTDVQATASIWAFTNDVDRQWWGGAWAERVLESHFAVSALRLGFATPTELQELSSAWLRWADDPDGTFLMPHGEIIARA